MSTMPSYAFVLAFGNSSVDAIDRRYDALAETDKSMLFKKYCVNRGKTTWFGQGSTTADRLIWNQYMQQDTMFISQQ